jgi:hypothetical protein
MADMAVGKAFPTLNTGQVLSVTASPATAIVQADVAVCAALLQVTNVVLVPQTILPLATVATAAVVPIAAQVVAPVAPASFTASSTSINIGGGGNPGGSKFG